MFSASFHILHTIYVQQFYHESIFKVKILLKKSPPLFKKKINFKNRRITKGLNEIGILIFLFFIGKNLTA